MPDASEGQRNRVVTEEGLGVAPSLLGQPLASPGRRLLAVAVDLIFVAILTTMREAGLAAVVGVAVLWLFLRRARGLKSWLWRGAAGLVTAAVASLLVLSLVYDGPAYGPSMSSWTEFSQAMMSQDPETRERALEVLEAEFEESSEQIEAYFGDLHTASEGEDSPEDAVRRLRRHILDLVRENQDLRRQVEDPSLIRTLRALAGDLGLEIGWAGVYFFLMPALWNGRTLGKGLLGLRIVRLDAARLTPWNAFERLGGYVAGVATGMLGFLQIFWDPNRQAVHDKIVGTVVIIQPASPTESAAPD